MSRERWDDKYRRGEHTGQAPLTFLASLAARIGPGDALDIGAGSGRHSRLLASLGWRVTAIDWSAEALAMLPDRVTRIQADLEAGEYEIEPGRWDLIVDTCYWQPSLVPAILAGVRPGGHVAMAIPLAGSMNPAYTVNPGELARLFDGWMIEHSHEDRFAEIVARKPAH